MAGSAREKRLALRLSSRSSKPFISGGGDMNAIHTTPRSSAESAFLAELLTETLGLAGKIATAIVASREAAPPAQSALSPIRRAEIAADAKMRAVVGAAMDREHARQMSEWAALAAAKRTPSNKRAPVANLKSAPFALNPAVVAKVLGLPAMAMGSVDVPISPVKLVDRPRRSEDPRLAKANDDSASENPIPSEPRLGSRAPESLNGAGAQQVAPANLDEAQHCHSLTSADEQTEVAGAQQIASRSRHPVKKSGHDVDGARGGVSRSMPVPEASPPLFSQDAHERELRRIDSRPPIKTSNNAQRRAAQRDADQAKAARIALLKASLAKVRARAAEAAEL